MATIYGTAGSDNITGTSEDDTFVAGGGNDVINGAEGNDTIDGGAGIDQISGGPGDDRLAGGTGDDSVRGEGGNDVIDGGDGNDNLEGGSGDDTVNGGPGMDLVAGGEGNDTLDGGPGNDLISGGPGDDTIIRTVGEGEDMVDAGMGVDTLVIGLSSATLTPEMLDDIRTLQNWINDKLAAAGGDMSVLAAETETPSIYLANLGLDVAMVEQLSFVVDGTPMSYEQLMNEAPTGATYSEVQASEDSAVDGQIEVTDPEGRQLTWAIDVQPEHGTVVLNAETGAYVYTPNANYSGQDYFSVVVTDPWGATFTHDVDISLAAVADAPTLSVADVNLTVASGDEQQTLALDVQAALTDTDGSETLSVRIAGVPAGARLSAGTELANGVWQLSAADLANLSITVPSAADFSLTVTATSAEANGSTSEVAATLAVAFEVEAPAVEPPAASSEIHGTDGQDVLFGTDAGETIFDGAGNDEAWGGAGDDTFVAGAGNDRYHGGDGFDTLDMSAALSAVVDLQNGRVYGLGNDRVDGFEGVIGSAGNDVIRGNGADNVIVAGEGNDHVNGRDGNDYIDGGNGNDILHGGRGNDVIEGGEGNDVLHGGHGNDVIDGGNGNDVIYAGRDDDLISDGAGRDYVNAGNGNDTVIAGAGNDVYIGGSGFDTIDFSNAEAGMYINAQYGFAHGADQDYFRGFEKIIATDYADVIIGNGRGETIDAGAGDDVIRGARGGDTLTGGEGSDMFVWERGDSNSWRHGRVDTITDFEAGDTLDFTELKQLPRRFSGEEIAFRDTDAGAMVSVQVGRAKIDVVMLEGVTADQAQAYHDDGYILV
ncbi:MAG: hypothetical protein RLZ98_320 [Pseudomonadota bacterium]|jgi:Ca2+-binding RTX toxin-like protein